MKSGIEGALLPRKRDPDATRQALLEAAFTEIHRQGFRGANLDQILAHTGVTKGALYHHFADKRALGYAVVDEVISDYVRTRWLAPLKKGDNPIDALQEAIRTLRPLLPEVCECGCPLNNLAQEMSPIDEGFREKLNGLYREWRQGVAEALRCGQAKGYVRGDIEPEKAATFLIAAFEGAIGMAKTAHDPELLDGCGQSAIQYLESLRRPVGI